MKWVIVMLVSLGSTCMYLQRKMLQKDTVGANAMRCELDLDGRPDGIAQDYEVLLNGR